MRTIQVREEGEKIIVSSQFTSFLDLVKVPLARRDRRAADMLFPKIQLDSHTKFSFMVIDSSLIQKLMDYNSSYSSFYSPEES